MQHPGRVNRRLVLTSFATLGLTALRPRSLAAKARFDVLELKTAIVGRIAEFVRWPAEAGLSDPERPFEFVVLGDTPLWQHLFSYYWERGVSIAEHRVFLRRARDLSAVGRPHLLFVGPSHEERLEELVAMLGRSSVLTMGDTEGYAHRGLAVNLYVSGQMVKFEASRRAFERHRLFPSYHLMALARLIDDQQARAP
jgi:hypothetical protein